MTGDHELEYHDSLVAMLEVIWGEGFLSPGGPEEVAEVLSGLDTSGLEVLDVGCGIGGVDLLLVEKHGAAKVLGIDIEQPILDRCVAQAAAKGLSDRITYQKVEPGPFPLADAGFDLVFSKDAMIHISDKAALFAEAYRVLRPGGLLAISDWMRVDDQAPTPEMEHYIKMEELSFGMASPARYRQAVEAAGFEEIELRDRNAWYRKTARQELESLQGPLYQRLVDILGQAECDHYIEVWCAMCVVLDSGELRPGHVRARKPG